jgi:hypothetical protein
MRPMSDNGSARPRQLTLAGWFVVVGSVMLVITVYSSIASLNSVETRDRVTDWLSTPTGQDLGLSVSDALSGLRVALMVTGLCAAASAVLGFFALQRHRGARIALSVIVVPILLANLVTAPLTGGLLGALIAAATVIMWTGPARDWFAGRPVRQPPEPQPREERRPPSPTMPPAQPPVAPPPVDLSTQRPSDAPAATSGFGERPAQQTATLPPQHWAPPTGPPVTYQQPAVTFAVPTAVKVACVCTWVFSGLVALVYVALLFVLVVARNDIVDYVTGLPEWQQSSISSDMLLPVLWLGSLLFLAWSVGALVLAWFTWRRHNWARYLLVVSAGVSLLASAFAFPVSLLHIAACIATIACLFTARSRAWFAMPTHGYWPPQGPPPGPLQGPPQGAPQGPPPGQSYGPPPPPPAPPASGPPPDRQGKPPVW